ncbi:MAG TPA: glycosyltransferase [Marinagarivorans sp.]
MKLHFWVFSYNRGIFLQNCVESISACVPNATVSVFDDNSTDPETQQILQTIAQSHAIVQPDVTGKQCKHGGLYDNMQAALLGSQSDDYIVFLQDDTQLVRPLQTEDFETIKNYFADKRNGFLQPAFLRAINKSRDGSRTRFDAEKNVFYVDRFNRSAGAYYSDIIITQPERLQSVDWRFLTRESANETQARKHFGQMGYMANPIAAWLPNVPAFRGKTQTWALKRAHQLSQCDFYPFEIMDNTQASALKSRPAGSIAYAEDVLCLKNNNAKLTKPWHYYPLQGRKILKKIHQLETYFR